MTEITCQCQAEAAADVGSDVELEFAAEILEFDNQDKQMYSIDHAEHFAGVVVDGVEEDDAVDLDIEIVVVGAGKIEVVAVVEARLVAGDAYSLDVAHLLVVLIRPRLNPNELMYQLEKGHLHSQEHVV